VKSLLLQNLCPELSNEEINRIAMETGFSKRIEKKIKSVDFLSFLCQESIKGTVSYNDLAAKISCEQDCSASRQAYFYRIKEEAVAFFEQILAVVMKNKTKFSEIDRSISKNKFKRILVQDSTIIRLPQKLYDVFSGVKNAQTTVCNARIQGIYDLIAGKFVSFSIDTYSCNDLKVVNDINVKQGDLVLRDRGYFVISSIEKMKEQGADSIMRYKHKTIFYDPISIQKIDLLKRLKQCGALDMTVFAGNDKNTKLRIIATPVPEEVANIRRMKAKKEAKKKTCSYELLQLFQWNIFITTIEEEDFTPEQAYILYSLRWRIESIFKTWKSNLNFDKIHNVSEVQLRVLLNARFIMITLLYQRFFTPFEKIILNKENKHLSLMKFMRFISANLEHFTKIFFSKNNKETAIEILVRYCTFDKRNRNCFNQILRTII